jgi:hypothetical protein
MFNFAMKNITVHLSFVEAEEKAEIEEFVRLMGGNVAGSFHDDVTHVVTDNVNSLKCWLAGEARKLRMKTEWVKQIWSRSTRNQEIIHGLDPMFDGFKLKLLHNVRLHYAGSNARRIDERIRNNGGLAASFVKREVDFLVLDDHAMGSYPHIRAKQLGITCLKVSWLNDSIERG